MIRVDDFFEKQAISFVEKTQEEESKDATKRFTGSSVDSFDGYLKEVDFRGQQWRGKLVMAGARTEIDCVFRGPSLDDIRTNLNQRVWAEGLAIYREESGVPSRLEISRIHSVKKDGDLMRWRGALTIDPEFKWGESFDEFE